MSANIEARVRRIFCDHLLVSEDKVHHGALIVDDLHADSLGVVEIVMAAEEEFGLEIPDDAAERVRTFGDAVALIRELEGRS